MANSVLDNHYLELVSTIDLDGEPLSIAVNEEINHIYVGLNQIIVVIDGLTNKIVSEFPLNFKVEVIKVNPKTNNLFISAFGISETYVLDGTTGSIIHSFNDNLLYSSEIAINPITNLIYFADRTVVMGKYDKVRILDGNSFDEIGFFNVPSSNEDNYIRNVYVAVNPSNNLLYVTWSGNNGVLYDVDCDTNEVISSKPYFNRFVYVNGATGYVYLGDLILDGYTLEEISSDYQGELFAIDSINNLIYSGYMDNLYVLDGSSHEVKHVLKLDDWIEPSPSIVNCDTGKFYLTKKYDKQVLIFELKEDDTLPSLTITSPTNNSFKNSSKVDITWIGKDVDSGISSYEFKLDDNVWSNIGNITKFSLNNIDEGNHIASVKVFDKVGNTIEELVNFVVDVTTPEINIVTPNPYSKIKEDSVTLTWISTDNLSGIDHYKIQIDDNPEINKELETSHQLTKLTNGEHKVWIKATDLAGNTNTIYMTFTVETSSGIPFIGVIESLLTVTVIAFLLHWRRTKFSWLNAELNLNSKHLTK